MSADRCRNVTEALQKRKGGEKKMNKLELQKVANEIRKGIVTSVHAAKAGHPGGSLSAAELFTYLYFEEMNIDPREPGKPDRDRFVLSKGHTAPGLYAALANSCLLYTSCREEHQVTEKLGKENRVLENLREESGMTGSPQK